MKQTALFAIAIAGLLSTAAIACPGGPPGGKNPEQRLQHMERAMDLNADQLEQVKRIFEARHEQAEAIRDKYQSPERRQMRSEMQALREQTHAELSSVLTAEQMEQLENMRSQRKRRYPAQ